MRQHPKSEMPTVKTAGTIIHLGAGRGHELAEYFATTPTRVILVEADRERAHWLENQTAAHEHIQVITAAVAAEDGTATFYRFNLRDLSSLHTPTGLYEVFPGLRITDQVEVDTVTPETLLEKEALEPGQGNWLIIDTPGTETEIITALQQAEMLHVFDHIDLNCGREPLYEGSESAETLLQQMLEQGHEVRHCDDETDPDRPRWRLKRNPLKVENQRLRVELQSYMELLKVETEKTEQLSSEIADCDRRVHLTNDEITKAEAQIELIKELLVRAPRP